MNLKNNQRSSALRFVRVASLAFISLLGSAVAQSSFTITNFSFEDGSAAAGVPTGWTLTNGSATGIGVGFGGSDGSKLLYMAPNTSIRQDLSTTLVSGETLTLEYDSSRGSSYARRIQLYAKNGGSYELLAETTAQTGSISWPTIQLTHTVAAQYDGLPLALQIVGDEINGNWNEFDNFRITSDATRPSQPYVRYRSDLGVTLNSSGHISNWATQTATGHDLDQVVASPVLLALSRSGGGTATVVDLDGSSALWVGQNDWGSLLGNRTVVVRARLSGSNDGFLFDGSTSAGMTRAQVRSGNWQAGVQSSDFTNADPNTAAITAQTWQTHIFQYEESGGNTVVTHWIDGTQVGSHSVSINTGLNGLIVGANGSADAQLDVEITELIVYNGLLTSAARSVVETELTTRWGDLIDVPFDYQSSTVVQNAGIVSSSGVQGIAALELTSTGNVVGDTVTSLTFNLNGTTDPADIDELQFYSSTSSSFDVGNATLLATTSAVAGSVSINAQITASKQYLWIAAKLSGKPTNGDLLDAEITELVLTGPSVGTHVPTVTAPVGDLTLRAHWFYSTVVRKAGDDGSASYRIPGLVTSNAGTLLAVFDIRWDNSSDLPGDIDVGLIRSTDGGYTCGGPMITVMEYD